MYVRAIERPNQDTILCEVVWFDGTQRMAITVMVKATIDEFSAPLQFGQGFVLREVSGKLPEHVQKAAVKAAKIIAKQFAESAD